MDIGAKTSESQSSRDEMPINYVKEFGPRKRVLVFIAGPLCAILVIFFIFLTSVIYKATAVSGNPFAIITPFALAFGIWTPLHAIFGYEETWRFESMGITRMRKNCVWSGQKSWTYNDVRNIRFKVDGKKIRPEFITQKNKWLPLPEQPNQETAEILKTEIGNLKRAAMSETS